MAKNYTIARVVECKRTDIPNTERHNERKNERYENADIDLNRSELNVYFKKPTEGYLTTFDKMCDDKTISIRGLKSDATIIDEFLFDINTSYFEENGGYDFAKEFYSKAYDFAVKEAGGEQYILSAVMHADERNSAVSEQLGKDVYHYHLHVVYIPVVQKEIKWSKRCKDKSLIGAVKEVITQVSHSKKWASQNITSEDGKKHFQKSYSLLQDRFFEYVINCGYKNVERGEKGSTQKNLSTLEYKTKQEKIRLQETVEKIEKTEHTLTEQSDTMEQNNHTITEQKTQIQKGNAQLEKVANKKAKVVNIDSIETKSPLIDKSKVVVDKSEFENLKTLAQKQVVSVTNERKLSADNKQLRQENQHLKQTNQQHHQELSEFKSVLNKLGGNKDKMRVVELEKFQETVYKFLEKLGVRKQFDDFMKIFQKQRNEVDR